MMDEDLLVDGDEPAFPRPYSTYESRGDLESVCAQDGMSLRDYFAAKAMQAMIGPETIKLMPASGTWTIGLLPQAAYAIADAMLEARKEPSNDH